MKVGRFPLPLVLIAVGIGAFAWSGPATAHDKAYESKVTIRSSAAGDYHGRVSSDKQACVRDRLVKLFRTTDDGYTGVSDTTDDEGRWSVLIAGPPYYAKVKRTQRTPGNHRHVCLGDKSRSISPPY